MERLRKSKLSFQLFGYYYTRRIVPNAADSKCKLHLPLIPQNLAKSCVFSSSSWFRQRFADDSLIVERFNKSKLHLPLTHQNLTKSRGFSSSSHVRLNFSPKSKPKRYFSLFLKLIAAALLLPVVYLGFQYFRHVKKVPYTNRKRFVLDSGYRDMMLGGKMLEKKKADKLLGEILPATHPQSVKVCSILKKLLDALHRDLGFDETPVVTYHGGNAVVESNQNEITGESFKEVRRKIRGWRTDIGHLKGLKWQVMVVDKPEQEAYTFGGGIIVVSSGLLDHRSNVEIAAVLAHEVGHCVARHVVESFTAAFLAAIANQKKVIDFHPIVVEIHQRAEKEADYIALQLMGSAGYDPHVYENLEINSEYEENSPISLKERIQLVEKTKTIYKL